MIARCAALLRLLLNWLMMAHPLGCSQRPTISVAGKKREPERADVRRWTSTYAVSGLSSWARMALLG